MWVIPVRVELPKNAEVEVLAAALKAQDELARHSPHGGRLEIRELIITDTPWVEITRLTDIEDAALDAAGV